MTTVDLTHITLSHGSYQPGSGEFCFQEYVAALAGEPHTDHPQCECPVLTDFGIALNDRLPDDKRQLLKPLAPEVFGTRGDGYAETRGYMALDWLIRTYLPAFLSLTERIDPARAAEIRALPPIVDMATARAAGELVRAARNEANAARDAAWDAATQYLAPTVSELQDSAIELYGRMIRVGRGTGDVTDERL